MAKDKITRREEIINAAIKLFARFSFQEISISAIAREANCGHSLVYHYFANVNEIYDAAFIIVKETMSPFIVNLDKSTLAPELKFVGLITNFIDHLKNNKNLAFYAQFMFSAHGPKAREIKKLQNHWAATLQNIVIEGQANNKLITTLTIDEFVLSVNYVLGGIINSIVAAGIKRKYVTAASVYLPFIKGGE